MSLLDHFALLAPHYDRIFEVHNLDRLLACVAPASGHRLLDVGGGTGRLATHFMGRVAQVCVLDPSPGMLQEGQRKGICITQGESEGLPFAGGTFDRVILIDAFHHLLDQSQAVRELVRVLAPGGRLVVEEPDIAHWGVKLVALGEKALLMRSHFFAPEAIAAMFERVPGERAGVASSTGASSTVVSTRIERQEHTAWIVVDKA
jgi:demethylmenaquinone methyltransferase/2-methoxy-6-polyprenyl-1,4-benzoquinol methylase